MAPRLSPPHHPTSTDPLADAANRAINEILHQPLRPRRARAYPRVIKRYGPCYRPIKRAHHQQTRYPDPAKIHILAA
jgi:hypothetical protein